MPTNFVLSPVYSVARQPWSLSFLLPMTPCRSRNNQCCSKPCQSGTDHKVCTRHLGCFLGSCLSSLDLCLFLSCIIHRITRRHSYGHHGLIQFLSKTLFERSHIGQTDVDPPYQTGEAANKHPPLDGHDNEVRKSDEGPKLVPSEEHGEEILLGSQLDRRTSTLNWS